MAMHAYYAPPELCRMLLLLRKSYERMNESDDPKTLTSEEYELCNGRPHSDKTFMYDERRQLKYAIRTLEAWVGVDGSSSMRPPTANDWKKVKSLWETYATRMGYESDDADVDDMDGDDSAAEEEVDKEKEEEEAAGEEEADDADEEEGGEEADDDDDEYVAKGSDEEEAADEDDEDDEEEEEEEEEPALPPKKKKMKKM